MAADDPLLLELPSALPAGRLEFSAGVRQFARELWSSDSGALLWMREADGALRGVRGFRLGFTLGWQASPRNYGSLEIPYFAQEYAPSRLSQAGPSFLDDPQVRRGDGLGDLRAQWRWTALSRPQADGGAAAFLALALSMPTGLAPSSSQHPLVASGEGGFLGELRLGILGRKKGTGLWLNAALLPFSGYAADLAPGALLAFGSSSAAPPAPAGGRVWISRDPGLLLGAGLSVDWHRSLAGAGEAAEPGSVPAHSLAVEWLLSRREALRLGGEPVPGTASVALDMAPQVALRFPGMRFLAGWLLPLALSQNRAESLWGELLLRADFGL